MHAQIPCYVVWQRYSKTVLNWLAPGSHVLKVHRTLGLQLPSGLPCNYESKTEEIKQKVLMAKSKDLNKLGVRGKRYLENCSSPNLLIWPRNLGSLCDEPQSVAFVCFSASRKIRRTFCHNFSVVDFVCFWVDGLGSNKTNKGLGKYVPISNRDFSSSDTDKDGTLSAKGGGRIISSLLAHCVLTKQQEDKYKYIFPTYA